MSPLKVGTEDRKKLIIAGVFGVIAVGSLVYELAGTGDSTPPPSAPPTVIANTPPVSTTSVSPAATATARVTPSKLDPTLHPEGMLLTESLVYSGNGRNIFLPGAPVIEKAAGPTIPKPLQTARYVPPTPMNMGPPPLPPIDLKFFGTATRRDGKRQAFLLHGDDVFVAAPGDVVSRRYKVGAITASSVEVTDMTNNNTQHLPMAAQ